MSEGLEYLAKAYFHQDYDSDAADPLDLIREFRREEPAVAVNQLIVDVRETLQLADESAMRHRWIDQLGAYYEPERNGSSYREWFEQVLEVLRGSP